MEVSPKQRLALRLLQGLALAALIVYSAHNAFGLGGAGFDGFAQDWLYNGLIVAAACFCLARGLLGTTERSVWIFLGCGIAAWSAGEIYYTHFLADLEVPPYPSVSDALYLAFYPASYIAIVRLLRARTRGFQLSLWIDGVIAAFAVAAVGSMILVQPILEVTEGNWATVTTDLAYPLADVLLLSMVMAVFALTGWRPGREWSFIGAGLVLTAVADGVFLYQVAHGTYSPGSIVDSLWPASTLLLAYAAWQRPRPAAPARLEGWPVLLVPAIFALMALGLLFYSRFGQVNDASAALATMTLVVVIVRMVLTFRENLQILAASRSEALTDALTGLANRRRLLMDLDDEVRLASEEEPRLLMLFDLDGFKRYNDTYGHQAGDGLLAKLGQALEAAVRPHGRAYRLGGDEFCVLLTSDPTSYKKIAADAASALSDRSKGFEVSSSYGAVLLPDETDDPVRALQLADQRMYGGKNGRLRSSASQQTCDALLQALEEKVPDLRDHLDGVADLAIRIGRRLDLSPQDLDDIARAAELHDVGKMAIPDSILQKPGPFDELEWRLVREHTLVGERILSAAPALAAVGKLVRASHERFDGTGYPDGLAGNEIPLGSRIISVCDAFHAMTSSRSYRETVSREEALFELRRCAGSQFDPMVVAEFCHEAGGTPTDAIDELFERPEDPRPALVAAGSLPAVLTH